MYRIILFLLVRAAPCACALRARPLIIYVINRSRVRRAHIQRVMTFSIERERTHPSVAYTATPRDPEASRA